MPDAPVGPYIEPGTPTGVGDELAHREVLRGVRQRPAPWLSAGSALGRVNGQVVGIDVRVVAQQQSDVELQSPAIGAAPRRIAAVVQVPRDALQEAGVLGAVLHQQVRRRFESVDRSDQVVPTSAEQRGPGLCKADDIQQQGVQRDSSGSRWWCWWC